MTQEFNMIRYTKCIPMIMTTLRSILFPCVFQALHRVAYIAK